MAGTPPVPALCMAQTGLTRMGDPPPPPDPDGTDRADSGL